MQCISRASDASRRQRKIRYTCRTLFIMSLSQYPRKIITEDQVVIKSALDPGRFLESPSTQLIPNTCNVEMLKCCQWFNFNMSFSCHLEGESLLLSTKTSKLFHEHSMDSSGLWKPALSLVRAFSCKSLQNM